MIDPQAAAAARERKTLVLSLLGLAVFLVLQALLLRSHVKTDTRPPAWDQAIHLEIALDYKQALAEGRVADAFFLAPKPGMPQFPPAYHLLLMRAYASPDPAHAALWVNWFYLALLAASIFGIAWRFRADDTALAVTIIFCGAPAVQDMVSTQLIDLPLAACVAAAYWALLASERFVRWGPALAFGALHAFGMLHKWSFFSYMIPAYFVALRALSYTPGRVLAAAALSAALSAPWYAANIALLPSRLVQASADFAIPFWKQGAWATYLRVSLEQLGPLFALFGWVAILVPQYRRRREDGDIMLAWAAVAYLFWTVVPNRQFRFLLPGLPALAVALASAFPRQLVWGVAVVQLFTFVNFTKGWIGPVTIPLPYQDLTFFVNAPPRAEDWKTEEILRAVEAARDPARAITNVTLVANDTHFNAPTFHWSQRRLGMDKVRMRGVNSRLCELSEFLILKDGFLGPPTVISQLPEAAAQVKAPNGWFARAYEQLREWPLPDGSTARLYRQRREMPRPFSSNKMTYQYFQAGKAELQDLRVALGEWDKAASVYKTAKVTAARVTVRGLVLRGLDAELGGAGLVPIYTGERSEEWVDARLLKLERLRLNSLDVGAAELQAFLEARVKGLKVSSVELEDGAVKVAGTWKGYRVAAEAGVSLLDAPRRLKVDVRSARFGGSAVPVALFRPIKELTVPLYPSPETPFAIELPGLTLDNGRLTVP
ncbi:MAG: hypothetical protein SF051_14875 [Elusimicrobiota bacterium]|nr:hypothetical protein [Elusimicrobiota bacterium]